MYESIYTLNWISNVLHRQTCGNQYQWSIIFMEMHHGTLGLKRITCFHATPSPTTEQLKDVALKNKNNYVHFYMHFSYQNQRWFQKQEKCKYLCIYSVLDRLLFYSTYVKLSTKSALCELYLKGLQNSTTEINTKVFKSLQWTYFSNLVSKLKSPSSVCVYEQLVLIAGVFRPLSWYSLNVGNFQQSWLLRVKLMLKDHNRFNLSKCLNEISKHP